MHVVLLLFPPLLAFLLTYLLTKYWIRVAKARGLVGRDMNKREEVLVPEAGGFPVSISISVALFTYVLLSGLLGEWNTFQMLSIYATAAVLLFSSFLGFVDDILGWKKGLPQWVKPLSTVPMALPFIALALLFPLGVGLSRFIPLDPNTAHLLYAFVLVPIGVVGAANAINMLAGFNGLEAGMSAIIILFMGIYALSHGNFWVFSLSITAFAALVAFLLFNWYPASMFPGDTLTYAMGAFIAALAILGNAELFGLILFIPYFLELVLKLRSRLELGRWAENFGIPQEDGTLRPRYERIYSVTHILQRIPHMTEQKLVLLLILCEVVLGVVGLAVQL